MASYNQTLLTGQGMSFDDSQTAGKAYTAIHHEINRAIIEQTDKDDKHSKEIIESLKALREELKQAAIANRDTRIRDLPSGVRGQFTDVGKTIERLVREMPNKQDWQNFKNDLGQGFGSKLEERFGKNTVGGTAAQLAAGAVGSVFGVGGEAQFVIRAIQESTEALREVGTGIKFLTKTTVEGIKKTGDVLGTIGSFFDPRNPQGITGKLISGLSNILSGNSFLTPLLQGIATIIPKFIPLRTGAPYVDTALLVYDLIRKIQEKFPNSSFQLPALSMQTIIDLLNKITPGDSGAVGDPSLGPRSSLGGGASPVKFTDAGGMRLLSGGFGETQSQAQKDERLIQLLAMQEQEDIHNVGRPQLAAYHPSDSSLGDIGTGMSTSSGGQSVSSGGQSVSSGGQQRPFHPGIIPSILGLLSSRRRPGAKRGLGKFNQGFPFKGFFQTGGIIPPGGVGVVGEDGAERIEATPSGAMVIPMPRPRSGSGAPGGPLISEINKRAVLPHEGFVNPLTNPNVEQSIRDKYANQKVPASIRLNNPGAVSRGSVKNPGAPDVPDKWGGYTGPLRPANEGGRYVQYNTPEEGLMGQGAVIQDMILNRGQNTIEKIIWGPGGPSGTKAQREMGYADRGQAEYVKRMSSMLGIDPKEELQFNKEFQYKWSVAQSQHEAGTTRPYTLDTYARAAGIDPDEIPQLAINAKDQSKPISGKDERGDAKRAADERQHQDRQQNRRHPVHRHQRVAGDFDDPQVAGIPQGVVPIAGSKGQPGQLTNVSGSDLGIGVRDVGKGKPWPVVSTQKLLEKEARAGGFESAIRTMFPGGKYSEDPIDWAGNVKNADVSNFPLSENIEDRRGEHFKSQPRWLGEKHMREEAMKASGINMEKIRKEGEKHDLEVKGGGPKASDHQQDIHRLKNERDDAKRAANERKHQDRQQNRRQQNRPNVPVHRPQRVVGDFHLAMLTSGNPSG